MKLKHALWISVYVLAAWLNGCGAEAAFAEDGARTAWSALNPGLSIFLTLIVCFFFIDLWAWWARKRK